MNNKKKPMAKYSHFSRTNAFHTQSEQTSSCKKCKQNHPLRVCKSFKSLSPRVCIVLNCGKKKRCVQLRILKVIFTLLRIYVKEDGLSFVRKAFAHLRSMMMNFFAI